MSTKSSNVNRALQRPPDYAFLSPRHQWRIDDDLGILDWDPTPVEEAEYLARWRERYKDEA